MTVSAWTTEVKGTRILRIKITQEVVPQSCFNLTFDDVAKFETTQQPEARVWHSNIFCTLIFVLGQNESQGTTTEKS